MEDCPRKKISGNNDNKSNVEEREKVNDKCCHQYLIYDVLRIIFEYLNGEELASASMVCRCELINSFHCFDMLNESKPHVFINLS